ncbi:unnamed protein product [Phyllotreta striolata]|uniref:Uncharacterized protein n=1 Tax=Phyllotreta striolata TaxID=444603 RepID=A0A9P0E0L5_PHYSR|nr:unnamed protein product [Phyllotreta striolata]
MANPPPSNINTEEIIDLDNYICNDERIQMWLDSFYNQMKINYGYEDVNTLENFMKWYINSLRTEVKDIKITRNVSAKIEKHIFYFHTNFKRLNVISDDTYLDSMEDILAFYLDCEVKRYINETRRRISNKKVMRSRILNLLSVYLINRKDRYHHVLMKMQSDMSSEAVKNYLNVIFMAIFSRKPYNKSDKAFCSAFVLSKRWKKTIPPDCWPTLDEIIKELYGRHPNTIGTNSIWKKITTSSGLIDSKDEHSNNDKELCEAYLKYVKSINLDDNNENENKEENVGTSQPRSSRLFQSSKQLSELEQLLEDCKRTETNEAKKNNQKEKNVNKTVDVDDDDDDDCIIISDEPAYIHPEDLVLEILDDDDDDVEDNSKNKETGKKNSPKEKKELSFLDSIDTTACSSSKADNPITKNNFKKSKNNRSQRPAGTGNDNQEPIIVNDEIDISEEKNNITGSSKNFQSYNDRECNYDERSSSPWPHSMTINFHELIASTTSEWNKLSTLRNRSSVIFEDLPEQELIQENQTDEEPSHLLNNTETEIDSNEVEIIECNTNIVMENTESLTPNSPPQQLKSNTSGEGSICSDFEKTEKLAVNQTEKVLDDAKDDKNSYIQEVHNLNGINNMNDVNSSANDVCPSIPVIEENQGSSLSTFSSNFGGANDSDKLMEDKHQGSKKRKRIIFLENYSVCKSGTLTSTNPPTNKTIQTIPSNGIPDDMLLKSKPLVIVERLSDIEIEGWKKISEKTRKIKCFETISRLNSFKSQEILSNRQRNNERPTRLNPNNDSAFYKRAYEGNWRETQELNFKEKESDINLILDDCATSSFACTNLCCHYISKSFENLTIGTSTNSQLVPAFYNHYQIKETCRRQEIPEGIFSNVNLFVHPSFGSSIPEVEEFERVSPLPLDLRNNKLPPDPALNTSQTEYCGNNKLNSDCGSCINSTNNSSNQETTNELKKRNEIKRTMNLLEEEKQIRLPLKKRKHSMSNLTEPFVDDNFIDPILIEEIIKKARVEKYGNDDISYPARPAISIAEIQL